MTEIPEAAPDRQVLLPVQDSASGQSVQISGRTSPLGTTQGGPGGQDNPEQPLVNEATVSAATENVQGKEDTMEIGGSDSMGEGHPDIRSFSSNVSDKHSVLCSACPCTLKPLI